MTTPEPTGFCWGCGRVCPSVFCKAKCRQSWEIEQRVEARRVVRRGKRDNYGPTGV